MSASLALAALSIVLETSGTHAASRPDGGMLLASAEALHLAGVAVWIGGIPFFLMALAQLQEESVRHDIWRRFSLMSACGVAAIFAGGTALAVDYVGAPALMYGTSYGVMLTAKILLFAMLLALGALNFLAADAPAQDRKAASSRTSSAASRTPRSRDPQTSPRSRRIPSPHSPTSSVTGRRNSRSKAVPPPFVSSNL